MPEIADSAKEVITALRQRSRSLGERGDSRAKLGYSGVGFASTVTDLGILRPDLKNRELTLVALHPGATVKEATSWKLRVAEELEVNEPPSEEKLRILRDLHARTKAAKEAAGWRKAAERPNS